MVKATSGVLESCRYLKVRIKMSYKIKNFCILEIKAGDFSLSVTPNITCSPPPLSHRTSNHNIQANMKTPLVVFFLSKAISLSETSPHVNVESLHLSQSSIYTVFVFFCSELGSLARPLR